MKKHILLLVLLLTILSFLSISATCTVTLDKTEYSPQETVTAAMVCDTSPEKSQAYSLTWTYQNGTTVETDTGTTPSTPGELFYESYTIPSGWQIGIFINATLTGTNLEGTDSANVTATGANAFSITNATTGGKWLGLTSSVKATVKDENGKLVSGGNCKVSIWSNDEKTMLKSGKVSMFNGEIKFEWMMDYESFNENTDYATKIICYCGSSGSDYECIDEEGTGVTNSVGETTSAFTTNKWITFKEDKNNSMTYQNGTDFPNSLFYAGYGEEAYWKLNMTNNLNATIRIESKYFIVNNETKSSFESTKETQTWSIGQTNPSPIISLEIPALVPSGTYFIRQYHDIYYNNVLVAEYVQATETFNITGTGTSFQITSVGTDKTNYYTGETLHVCANVTNNYNKRVEFEILYNYRCGSPNSGDFSTDSSLLGEHTELRAVSAGISQYQCAELDIPFIDHILYRKSQCYASVTLKSPYINTFDNKLSITSPHFNVTDFGLFPEYEIDSSYPLIRVFPNWRRFDDNINGVSQSYFRAKVNISQLNESYLDSNNEISDSDWDIYTMCSSRMPDLTELNNYSIEDENGAAISNEIEAKALQWKNREGLLEQRCSIGIENLNLSDPENDYFVIYMYTEDFTERQTEALEGINYSANISANALVGIENKTGTFHLDVTCPSQGLIGGDLNCSITAQIEDDQTVQKEVDFTCYITGDGNTYSSVNFNQMITQAPTTLYQEFPVPSTLSEQQYTLQCHADYYNLGSRRDSFYDTFNVVTTLTSGGSTTSGGSSSGGWSPNETYSSPLTGGAITDIDSINNKKITNIFRHEDGSANYLMITLLTIIIAGTLIFLITFYAHKKHKSRPQRKVWTEIILGGIISIGIVATAVALYLGYQGIAHILSKIFPLGLSDPLFRGILLTTFILLAIILTFKALNLTVDITMGHKDPIHSYWKKHKKHLKH